jgi:hypothetical protein
MPDRTLRYVLTAEDRGASAAMGQTAAAGEKAAAKIGGAFSQLGGMIGGELGGAIEKIGAGITGLGEHGSEAGKKLATFGVATAAAGIALTALGANGKRATDQLKVAIENTGNSFGDYSDQIEKTVKQQENFGHRAEDTKNALQKLTEATQDPTKALQLMGLTADIAAARHIDLVDAATLVAKVLGGTGGKILAAYGITMEKNADGTKNVDLALQQLAERVQGQASASVDNFSGKVDVVLTKLQDWATEIGSVIGPALSYLGGAIAAAGKVWQFFQERSAAAAAANALVAASSTETADIVIASSAQMDEAIGSIGATSRLTAAQYVAASAAIEASSVEMAAIAEGSAAQFDAAMASQAAAAKATAAANADARLSLLLLTGGLGVAAAAIAAAAVGAVVLVKVLGDGTETVRATASGIKELNKSLMDSGGSFDANSQKILANTLAQGGYIDKAAKAGISVGELTLGVTGNAGAMQVLIDKWRASGKPSEETIFNLQRLNKEFNASAEAGQKAAASQRAVAAAADTASPALSAMGQEIQKEDAYLAKNKLTLEDAKKKFADARAAAFSFTAELGYMSTALDILSNNQINARLGQLHLADAWDVGKGADSALTQQIQAHGKSLLENTRDGRSNQEWLIGQILTINQQALQQAKATGSIKQGTDSLHTNEDALRTSAIQAGFTRAQVDALINKYKATPGDVMTSIRQQGQEAVVAKLGEMVSILQQIADPAGWNAKVSLQFQKLNTSMPLAAKGGLIGGGGGPTADDRLIAASSGEFIMNADATAANLPLLAYLNNGAQKFAAGGLIGNAGGPHLAGLLKLSDSASGFLGTAWWNAWENGIAKDVAKQYFDSLPKPGASIPGGAAPSPGTLSALQDYAFSLFRYYGWDQSQLGSLIALWNGESGWNPAAYNASSGATGIPQSLPASKMASAGADYLTNGATQIRWGENYIHDVYGSPSAAYGAWLSRSPHWYGDGMPPSLFKKRTLIGVGESGPETVSVSRGDKRGDFSPRAIAAAVADALSGATFRFDGDGLATLVTKKQRDYAVRGGRR